MSTETVVKLPSRSEVKPEDTWDLTKLFADDAAWDAAFDKFSEMLSLIHI